MLRAALWTLRQPRYAALAVAAFVLAAFCVGAGTFELHRYHEKRADNARLHANATAPASRLTTSMVPLTGRGAAPDALDIRYCLVTVTGRYDPTAQTYLDDQTRGGKQGFYVLTPLRTADGVLLVARGFVAADSAGHRPAAIPAPPGGTVSIAGRLQTASTTGDELGTLGRAELTSVNPAQQAARLGAPVYQAYLTLTAGRLGAAGLGALPEPPASNPTGGAAEWQLLSYVVQWWVFALLLLLAPFAICRAEVREARRRYLGLEDVTEFDLQVADERLPALTGGGARSGELALRTPPGSLARPADVPAEQWERATRLADRYGRSLGPDDGRPLVARRRRVAGPPVRTSATQPHRSEGDDVHGSYNDYLWQLALRDGDLPAGPPLERPARPAVEQPAPPPRVVDADDPNRPAL